jgi:transposase
LLDHQHHLAGLAAGALPETPPQQPATCEDSDDSPAQSRLRRRHQSVHELATAGLGAKTIARQLNLARGTVRRYLRAPSVTDLLNRRRAGRPSRLDPFVAYLHQRLAEGATNATALFREIADRGYHGSPGSVRAYLKPLRELAAQLSDSGPIPAPVPKPRKISSRICTALATFVTRTDAPEGTPRDIDSGEQHCHHSVRDLSTRPSRRPL